MPNNGVLFYNKHPTIGSVISWFFDQQISMKPHLPISEILSEIQEAHDYKKAPSLKFFDMDVAEWYENVQYCLKIISCPKVWSMNLNFGYVFR